MHVARPKCGVYGRAISGHHCRSESLSRRGARMHRLARAWFPRKHSSIVEFGVAFSSGPSKTGMLAKERDRRLVRFLPILDNFRGRKWRMACKMHQHEGSPRSLQRVVRVFLQEVCEMFFVDVDRRRLPQVFSCSTQERHRLLYNGLAKQIGQKRGHLWSPTDHAR